MNELGQKTRTVKHVVSEMLTYTIGESGQLLHVTDDVLHHFLSFQQKRFFSKEAGGQLFLRSSGVNLYIELATGPRPTDVRSRNRYIPDMAASQAEIDEHYKNGLNFIGNWHTHPEDLPTPSEMDVDTMKECFSTAQKDGFYGFILIIVGRAKFPEGLHVSVHDGKGWHQLQTLQIPSA